MKRAALLALLLAGPASAMDAADLAGLSLVQDLSRTSMEVDGVPLQLERVRGRDVERLAQRIGARWAASGADTRSLRHGEWRLLSRLDQRWSEVIQWRLQAGTGELLFSRLDLRARPTRPRMPWLPAECEALRIVHAPDDRSGFTGATFRCHGAPPRVAARWADTLRAQGWRLQAEAPPLLRFDRPGETGELVLGEEADHRATRGVLVTTPAPLPPR